jgi:PAS domain S-box-containing protein
MYKQPPTEPPLKRLSAASYLISSYLISSYCPTGGHEIRTQLTADEKTAHIPVLILGAAGDVDDGITEFLPAPIDCISNSFHGRNEARTNTTPPHQSDLDKVDETEFQIKNQEVNRAGNGRQMLARALDKAVERIAIIAPDGRYLYVNEAGCRTMNYSRQEMLTLRVSDVDRRFSQDDWSAHFEELKKNRREMATHVGDRPHRGGEHIFEVFSRYHKEGSDEFHLVLRLGRDRKRVCGQSRQVLPEHS